MVRIFIVLSLLLAVPMVGCFPMVDCTEEARSSITARVFDTSGIPVAEANVTYTADGWVDEPCESFDGEYICGWEVAGEITVRVEAWGFQEAEKTVTVAEDECHVIGETVEFVLQPVDCTEQVRPSVTVTVVDIEGDPVVDAVVEYSPECEDWFAPEPCHQTNPNVFVCGYDYICPLYIDAVAPGYEPQTAIVDPDEDECGPINTPYEFALEPYMDESSS